jgi:hypothetical protein
MEPRAELSATENPALKIQVVQKRPLRAARAYGELTTEREIAPYIWVHPDDDRR